MTTENPYLDLILELQSNHFYPASLVEIKRKKEVVCGLSINCPPILKEGRLEAVRKVIGEKYFADFLPNKAVIEIKAI